MPFSPSFSVSLFLSLPPSLSPSLLGPLHQTIPTNISVDLADNQTRSRPQDYAALAEAQAILYTSQLVLVFIMEIVGEILVATTSLYW